MIIDIVGQETAKVYSKNIFKDDNIDEAIELIEKELREEQVDKYGKKRFFYSSN